MKKRNWKLGGRSSMVVPKLIYKGLWGFLFISIFLVGTISAKDREPLVGTHFDGEIDYWISDLKGHMKIEESSIEGTKLDFDDDLGVDETEYIFNFRLVYRFLERHSVEFAYFSVGYSKTDYTLTRDFTHQGVDYAKGTSVTTEIDLECTDYLYGYDLIRHEKGELTINLGVRYGELHQALTGTHTYTEKPNAWTTTTVTANSRRAEAIKAFVPIIGLGGEFEIIKGLSISGRLRGLSIDTADVADIFDIEGDLETLKLVDGAIILNYDPIKYLRILSGIELCS